MRASSLCSPIALRVKSKPDKERLVGLYEYQTHHEMVAQELAEQEPRRVRLPRGRMRRRR